MHKMMAKRGGCIALVVLFMSMMVTVNAKSSTAPTFTWSDCGVQLYKDIHYQSASISPNTADAGNSLSINVQALISNRIIYDAETRLIVWKDDHLFLDVYIENLCAILANTNALTCPLNEGPVSFTYTFGSVPTLVSGKYVIQIKSYDGSVGLTDTSERGCIQFNGTVQGVSHNVDDDKCAYLSNFATQLDGTAYYTNSDVTARKQGDYIQIGPLGNLSTSTNAGTFIGAFLGTPDIGIVGGQMDSTGYTWALNGTLSSRVTNKLDAGVQYVDTYVGTFFVMYQNTIDFQGYFSWTFTNGPGTAEKEQVTGSMWLDPEYYYGLSQFTWPVVVGNLGPFYVERLNSGYISLQGNHTFCTCGVDACGVCNGNGKSCGLGTPSHHDHYWGPRRIAAVACGCVAAVLLAIVIDLSYRIHRRRGRIPIDDTDLLDHPEKPDYGTMAIDDAIREGERVV